MSWRPPPSRAHLDALIHRVTKGLSAVELVHVPHDRWPHPAAARAVPNSQHQASSAPVPLRVSVLDSSFNPPTLAHLALASLSIPSHDCSSSTAPPTGTAGSTTDFDARLLLLSVRNADKNLKTTDATYVQRLEMMIHLAEDVRPAYGEQSQVPNSESRKDVIGHLESNIAVAIIDEPTFVGKARALTEYFRSRLAALEPVPVSAESQMSSESISYVGHEVPIELSFVVGVDTLERILAPRYYPSPSEMRSSLKDFFSSNRLISSRRIPAGQLREAHAMREQQVLRLARDYMDVSRLSIVDIGDDVESFSSSEVRQRIGEGDAEMWPRMVTPSIADYIRAEGLYSPLPINRTSS